MIANETTTDVQTTIYQLLCTMTLNGGHLRATVNDLYPHLPAMERDRQINNVITNVYSLIPPDKMQTAIKNQEILDRSVLLPQDRPIPFAPAPHRGAFHGLKVGVALGMLGWFLLFAGFFMIPRFLHYIKNGSQELRLSKY